MDTNSVSDLYVIATIFNPAGFKTRLNLYHQFSQHMQDSGVNLITIECSFGPDYKFHVTEEDNPSHIQVKAKNPLWIKENMINIAMRKLPINWKFALWLDADIEFLYRDWPLKIIQSFNKYEIIQVFNYAHFLGPNNEIRETHYSFLYAIVHNLPISKPHYSRFYPHPGYGWGISRKVFEELGGLYEFGVVGSGDGHMAFSLIERGEDSLPFDPNLFSRGFINTIYEWQRRAQKFVGIDRIGYADVPIKHYFHGFREDRQYVMRMKILTEHGFDPLKDLEYNEFGVLQLKEDREDLKLAIKNYFFTRKEDKTNCTEEIQSMKLPFKKPEEVLKSAYDLKADLEKESFKKIFFNFFTSRFQDGTRRSRSSENRRLTPRNKKGIEMYYEMNLSDSKSSTDNSLNDSSLNPSPRGSVGRPVLDDHKLITRCGICFSSTKDKDDDEAPKSNNQNQSSNLNVQSQNQNQNQNNHYANSNMNNNNNTPNNPNLPPEESKFENNQAEEERKKEEERLRLDYRKREENRKKEEEEKRRQEQAKKSVQNNSKQPLQNNSKQPPQNNYKNQASKVTRTDDYGNDYNIVDVVVNDNSNHHHQHHQDHHHHHHHHHNDNNYCNENYY